MFARTKRNGFSLVELVVVVLIIGILAAVAAPRMFDTAGDARQSGTKQSLAVVRSAIEMYKAQNGNFPAAATIKTDLRTFLKGPFPRVQVGSNQNDNISPTSQSTITNPEAGGAGWAYNETTGEFVINEAPFITTW
jgi:general secretion pathway protein G